jgi:hypothetical protein
MGTCGKHGVVGEAASVVQEDSTLLRPLIACSTSIGAPFRKRRPAGQMYAARPVTTSFLCGLVARDGGATEAVTQLVLRPVSPQPTPRMLLAVATASMASSL